MNYNDLDKNPAYKVATGAAGTANTKVKNTDSATNANAAKQEQLAIKKAATPANTQPAYVPPKTETGGTPANTSGGGSGGTSGGTNYSGITAPGSSGIVVRSGGSSYSAPAAATEPATPTEDPLLTNLNALKDSYSKSARGDFDYAADRLRQEKDQALREQFIENQLAEAGMDDRLANAGITGGARETNLSKLASEYQSSVNGTKNKYLSNLEELMQNYTSNTAETGRAYDDKWLDYLISKRKLADAAAYG